MNPERCMESADDEDNNVSNVVALGVSNDGQTGKNCPQSNICEKVVRNVSLDNLSVQYSQRVAQCMQPVFAKDCGKSLASGVAKVPSRTTLDHQFKVGPTQLGKRRRLQFETTQKKSVENSQNPSEFQGSSCADIVSPHDIQLTGSTQSTCPLSPSQNTERNLLTVSKPSGIGLHLNSIVNARPLAKLSIKSTEGSGKMSISISSRMPDNVQSPLISSNSNLVESLSARSEEYTHETSYGNTPSMEISEHQDNFDQASFNTEGAEKVDELDRSNLKKKRKKKAPTGDGCKHCNCKKSKCLKLYCDCFAVGVYCSGPCSCQGCFNRPEYEGTVLETRQQIESRNPLAFAPKIINRLVQPPISQTVEDGDQLTPPAGRHKRGCNCKKSMCLKKYCECYQENVGCSDGCHCEGCQNIYGMRRVSVQDREMDMEAYNEKLNDPYDDKLKVGSIGLRSSLPEFHKPENLTPQTPSFQCSDHGKDTSKALVFPQRYIPSPESECTFYPPYVTTPQSPITEASNKNHEMVPYDQESYPSMEFMDELSPKCTATSTNELTNNSGAQLLHPSGVGSSLLRLCGTSIIPGTPFGRAKLSDSQQKSVDIIDDDTPKILRDSFVEAGNVKVTSPNKKRISPPRLRLHELGSSTLKSGRKFILKSVPSFPTPSPCIESKGNTGQNSNDPPHDSTL